MKATEWKCGLSCGNVSTEIFEGLAKARIDCMEVSTHPNVFDSLDWKRMEADAVATGVKMWSVHLPFYSSKQKVNLATHDEAVRRQTIDYHCECLKKAGDVGIGVAVVHPSSEPNPTDEAERIELMKISAESMSELADTAEKVGITLAVEDLPRSCLGHCSNDFKYLLTDDRLRVCFDINHLLIEKNLDFIEALGKKIITLHVSDYDFLNERHWLPGEGKNDWCAIVAALEKVGYAGPWLYELGRTAPASIARRELTFEDFRHNYEECVSGKMPTAIGTPVMEEVMKNAFYQTPQF